MLHRICRPVLWPLAAFVSFAILSLCWAAPALATDLHLSWSAVTTDANGKALPSGSSVSYNVWGAAQGQPLRFLANVTTTTHVRPNVDPGTACYAVSAVLVTQNTTAGVEGAQTTPVCTTVDAPPPPPPAAPAAPANLQIQPVPTPTAFLRGFTRRRVMYA